MDIDFIEASGIFDGKDTPFFGHLQPCATYATGRQLYELEGCRKLQVCYTPSSGMLVLRGSVMYFAQGHNFTFDKRLFVEAIDYIGKLLQVNLWGMDVGIVECGVIVEVDSKPKDYIAHHREGKGMLLYSDPKDKGNFRSFNDNFAERKMYDAGRNIQHKQGTTMKGVIQSVGWDPNGNWLKWEVHYLKPHLLNRGRAILLGDIVTPYWENRFSADVYSQYKAITPMKSLTTPSDKADLRAIDIFAMALAETKINDGLTIGEVRRLLYDRINASAILSKSDKDARKRKVKATLDKISETSASAWDISERLQEALGLSDNNGNGQSEADPL